MLIRTLPYMTVLFNTREATSRDLRKVLLAESDALGHQIALAIAAGMGVDIGDHAEAGLLAPAPDLIHPRSVKLDPATQAIGIDVVIEQLSFNTAGPVGPAAALCIILP